MQGGAATKRRQKPGGQIDSAKNAKELAVPVRHTRNHSSSTSRYLRETRSLHLPWPSARSFLLASSAPLFLFLLFLDFIPQKPPRAHSRNKRARRALASSLSSSPPPSPHLAHESLLLPFPAHATRDYKHIAVTLGRSALVKLSSACLLLSGKGNMLEKDSTLGARLGALLPRLRAASSNPIKRWAPKNAMMVRRNYDSNTGLIVVAIITFALHREWSCKGGVHLDSTTRRSRSHQTQGLNIKPYTSDLTLSYITYA